MKKSVIKKVLTSNYPFDHLIEEEDYKQLWTQEKNGKSGVNKQKEQTSINTRLV